MKSPSSIAIYGPPGTGKTRRLIEEAARLVEKYQGNVALLSFSRSAARELSSRIARPPAPQPAYCGTIHALAFQTLGLSKIQVADVDAYARFVGGPPDWTAAAVECHGRSRRTGAAGEETWGTWMADRQTNPPAWPVVRGLIEGWVKYKEDLGLLDFDDMLWRCQGRWPRFRAVVVDESQDLTPVQWMAVREMAMDGELIVAGDDDQAIFEWSGADPHGMVANCSRSEVLTHSWRLPVEVWSRAVTVAHRIHNRKDKEFTHRGEHGVLREFGGYTPMDKLHTVLVRDQWIMKDIERVLIQLAIPYSKDGAHGKGLFQGHWARVARMLFDREEESREFIDRSLRPWAQDRFRAGLWPIVAEAPGWLDCDDEVIHYLERVDLNADPIVHLSTIHGAKGREWDNVVLIGDGELKAKGHYDPRVWDAECRVWYTGLTRAKRSLVLVRPNAFIR